MISARTPKTAATALVRPVALKQSVLRDRPKPVKVRNFNPAVRVSIVHRPPLRLVQPIKASKDHQAKNLQALMHD